MDFLDIFGEGPEGMLLLFVALGLVVLLVAAVFTKDARQTLMRRIDKIKRNHARVSTAGQTMSARRSTSSSDIATLDELINKHLPQQDVLRLRLARAGLEISLGVYVLISLCIGALVFMTIKLYGYPVLLAFLIGFVCSLLIPHVFVNLSFRRRQTKFIKYFPEAIDLMVRGVKAGLPIVESMQAAAEEIPDPVGNELTRITDGIRLGRNLDEMLWETSHRLDLQEFKFFTIALSIQRETGGNISESLNNLSEVLRSRRHLKRKVKAMSSEAKASAYIIGSLPFIMTGIIYTTNPEYITGLFTDPRGQIAIGGALLSIVLGVAVMFKMVRFEV